MNLAMKDLRRQRLSFSATALGLGLLFAIVLAMGGIYRGLVEDATLLVDHMNADLWVVQRDTRGPFAERSTVPPGLEDRLRAQAGVASARSFSTATIQRAVGGRSLRMSVVGLSWPEDKGQSLPLVAGRPLRDPHREVLADRSLWLALGQNLPLGDETFTVVGLTKGMLSSGGDGCVFATELDARGILAWQAPEARRLEREGRLSRLALTELDSLSNQDRLKDERFLPPTLAPAPANAVLVYLRPGASLDSVRQGLETWPDVTVYTAQAQRDLLLKGVVEKSKKQIGLFRALLSVVSGIVVTLILYNMTVAKTHDIALLKLLGARSSVVVKLVLHQGLLLGAMGYGFALAIAKVVFPLFPRRVVLGPGEFIGVGLLVFVLVTLASAAGILRALRIPPTLILAG
ncbi:MAG: ABC transporter permease [Acidobacteria bacterium]|nr:ABC transporter permease [Acidobacteriota bacterium]